MEQLKEISQKQQIRPFRADFSLKKVHQGVFKYLLLKCTTKRDVLKRTCLIGAFIQHLAFFWLEFLRPFLSDEV